ncbi:MAG: hypothetical protein A3J37_07725 [Alphaproteobacteria bacterium RIFCSPHIGHO2_12_FULL_45_9]|nr:MAG: hypothetical protein A3J37_07725 [Alphaproteobacteria bacterium RIFCSPHIGHO2_12_FULL_45_9]
MRQLTTKSSGGFTLIELSFVILISGIILVAFLSVARSYIVNIEQEKLTKVVAYAKTAIIQYRAAFGAYPCPARGNLAITDTNYGRSDCTITPVGGVMIGILPKDKNLGDLISSFETVQTNFMDPWDRPLVYAVTATLTNSGTFNPLNGLIDIEDENGDNTGGVKNNAHFVVLSYGKNASCPTTGSEAENCDGDNKFISSIRYNDYDDKIAFHLSLQASLWSDHLNSSNVANGNAKNDNTGNIGIGTNTPSQKLDVVGDISVSDKVMSQRICEDTTTCMRPETLFNISCSTSGQYLSGITLNSTTGALVPICTALNFPNPTTTTVCPHGVKGIFTSGLIECAN